ALVGKSFGSGSEPGQIGTRGRLGHGIGVSGLPDFFGILGQPARAGLANGQRQNLDRGDFDSGPGNSSLDSSERRIAPTIVGGVGLDQRSFGRLHAALWGCEDGSGTVGKVSLYFDGNGRSRAFGWRHRFSLAVYPAA